MKTTTHRYLLDHSGELPLGVLTRLLTVHDLLSLLLPLPATRPWLQRHENHSRVFTQGTWQRLPQGVPGPQPPDVQLWLALHHVLLDPIARSKLGLDSPNRLDRVLQLRRHLTEALLTKVPPLCQLQRFLEELALSGVAAAPPTLVVEHTTTLWEGLCGDVDWAAVAAQQQKGHLSRDSAGALRGGQVAAIAEQFDALCGVMDLQEGPVRALLVGLAALCHSTPIMQRLFSFP